MVFFSSFRKLSVLLDEFLLNFDMCCIAPKKDFSFSGLSGLVFLARASVLSVVGFIPLSFIMWPSHSVSFSKNTVLHSFAR